MTQQVPCALKDLIVQFVNTYSSIVDLELDEAVEPKLWFMPLNNYEAKREASHYFLLASSLSDFKLTGNPRNIRLLLNHLHEKLGKQLYGLTDPKAFKAEVARFEQKTQLLDRLGEEKKEIPEVLCSVNRFVATKASGDLVAYSAKMAQKGLKPKDMVQQLSYGIKRMNKQHKAKAWLYMRWMVRGSPDLGLFEFSPKDLMVALTTPKLRVHVALGLSENEDLAFDLNNKIRPESWWQDTKEFDEDTEKFTAFARLLFVDDPARVDFSFFILGTWLDFSDLTHVSIEKSMRFFIKKHQELLQPLTRYLTVVYHYNRIGERIVPGAFSAFEQDIHNFLKSRQVIFHYEFMEFCLSKDNPSLTYKPDFLLPRYTNRGRKIILEPHGVKENLKDVAHKLSVFREHYGEFFCIILIVPDDFTETINNIDPDHKSYDLLWKRSEYKTKFENFQKT